MNREEKAFKRMFGGKPEPQKPVYPSRSVILTGPKFSAKVTLQQKYGVWFIADCKGSLRLYDFTALHGWGDTEVAVKRCATRLGLTISDSDCHVSPQKEPVILNNGTQ